MTFPDATDSESDSSSLERKRSTDGYSKINRKPPQSHKRKLKKRVAIPVQPPKIPSGPFTSDLVQGGGGPPSGSMAAALMYQKFKNEINSSTEKGEKRIFNNNEILIFFFVTLTKLTLIIFCIGVTFIFYVCDFEFIFYSLFTLYRTN